jgi:hypothetical protein
VVVVVVMAAAVALVVLIVVVVTLIAIATSFWDFPSFAGLVTLKNRMPMTKTRHASKGLTRSWIHFAAFSSFFNLLFDAFVVHICLFVSILDPSLSN